MSSSEILESFLNLRRCISQLRSTETKGLDFGHNQIGVLYRLLQSNATMGELAEHTLSDKASMTRTISVLEKLGLVKRIADQKDRRITHIELTVKGKQKALQAQEIRNSIGEKLDQCLSATERKQLSHLVQKISENLKSS